jgi:hypothetical protein
MVDVSEGHEADFFAVARDFEAVVAKKGYGRAEVVGDEAQPRRFYLLRHWTDAAAAASRTSAARRATGAEDPIGGWGRGGSANVRARSIWSPPRGARANTPTPPSRTSRSARRSNRPTAP